MWKKPDEPRNETPTPTYSVPERSNVERAERAVIGASLSFKGEISGAEDLLIQGFVEGTVSLKQNVVTIGRNGRVTANVYGKTVHVEGELNGDCLATEQVVVHKSGCVKGNISAPRVTLEDGARLKGAIDTSAGSAETSAELARTAPTSEKAKTHTSAGTPKREGTSPAAQV